MPRARLSSEGIDVAKLGYDVDTASLANMMFSSSLVAARISQSGTVTPTGYDSFYNMASVTFPTAAPRPPMVLVAGITSGSTSEQAPFLWRAASNSLGEGRNLPYYEIRTFTDHFELYVAKMSYVRPAPATWRYWVFQNTLDA